MRNFKEPEMSKSEQIVHVFIHVLHMHRAAAEKMSEDIGLFHSQHMMLKYLIHLPYEPNQKQIADALEISPAAVAVTLKKLESAGYISRKTLDGDNRCNRIILTEQGKTFLSFREESFPSLTQKCLTDLQKRSLTF